MRNAAFSLGLLAASLWACAATCAHADRVIFTPEAGTLGNNAFKAEFAIHTRLKGENVSWLQFTSPQSMEFEYQRLDLFGDPKIRHAFNLQYPILSDLGTFPAFSVGVRDLIGTSLEKQSFYAVIGKALPLSDAQLRLWKEVKVSFGVGTGRFEGAFFNIQTQWRRGFSLQAELYRYRPNVSLGLPLIRNLQAKAYSMDGRVFYGLTYTLIR